MKKQASLPPKNFATKKVFVERFIDRPVLAWVLNIVLFLLGAVAYFYLGVRQYPQIEYPMITVLTQYEGANPEVMEMQVTRPLEETFSSLEGLSLMTSQSTTEQSKIVLRFKENRSLDSAAADVRDRLSRMEQLPKEAAVPRVTKADIDAGSVMSLTLSSDRHSVADLYDYTLRSLKSEVESTQGVASVEIYGGAAYEMHVILDPAKLGALKLTALEVSEALKQQNFNKPAGRLGTDDQEFLVTTKARLSRAEEFNDLVLFEKDNYIVRVRDIGSVKLSQKDTRFRIRYNGKESVMLDVMAQSRANPVQISKDIHSKLETVRKNLPAGMSFEVAFDQSLFIQESISRVFSSIWEAIFLVFLVVLIFLRSLRVVLIPLVTIPISLVGAFFMAYLLGFSLNILTLLALVLAVGLVVDDAIVVLENIYRNLEKGLKPKQAAYQGVREIQSSVIGMTLTLVAVYAPIAFAQGLVGKLFKEFALTLVGSVLISGFVALVLSPVMCAYLLKPATLRKKTAGGSGLFFRASGALEVFLEAFETQFSRLTSWYSTLLPTVLVHARFVFLGSIVAGLMGYGIAVYFVPQEMAPREDQGIIRVVAQAPVGATLSYLDKHAGKIDEVFAGLPFVERRLLIEQVGDESYEKAMLVPRSKRPACKNLTDGIQEKLSDNVSGVRPYAYCASRSFGGESARAFSLVVQTDKSYDQLVKIARKIRRTIDGHPGLSNTEWDLPQENREYQMTINRNIAASAGARLHDIATSLDLLIGGRRVSSFEKDSRIYPVKVMVDSANKRNPNDLKSLMVRGRKDQKELMIPLQELVQIQEKLINPAISHYNRMRSVKIDAAVVPGGSLMKIYKELDATIRAQLPSGFRIQPAGTLRRFLDEQNTTVLIFGLALLFIFLVMAAQFESFRDPFIILCSVPLALVGGVLTLWLVPGGSLNIYSQIGLITLVGLITKHGILLVDFANQEIEAGKERLSAVVQACRLRLRPILMTTLAMVLGALPLVWGTNAGFETRRQVGWVIVGGMIVGTLFTLFVVPAVYTLFSKRYAHSTS